MAFATYQQVRPWARAIREAILSRTMPPWIGHRPGNRFHLDSKDDFGMRSHGIVETLGANRTKFYPLPRSTAEEYIRLRPEDLRIDPITPDHYERQEVIGPHQIEDGRIWFGNRYYYGEGMSGVVAFGYFDTATRRYTLFSPPEVARCEISAILVETHRVWIALDHFGEDISTSPRGFIRWNREREVRRFLTNGRPIARFPPPPTHY